MNVKSRVVKTAPQGDSGAIEAFRLSTRQTQIAQLAATGLSNREIASDLNLTEQIVKNALHSVFDRLGVWNRVELANFFLRNDGQSRELGLRKIDAEYLSVLEGCKILDSKAEGMFDEMANIAATVIQVSSCASRIC